MVGAVAVGAGVAIAAIGAITAAVVTLAVEGSHVEDVTNSFDRMSGGVDAATANLDAMSKGLHGTVDDMDLMTLANKMMAAGMQGSAADFGTLASAAFDLSKTGIPLSEAENQITTAMVRGVAARGVLKASIGDTKAAEEAMSSTLAAQGLVLDPANKLIADRQGMMQYLKTYVAAAGEQELTFSDQLNQGKVSFQNWLDKLELAVATSPELNAALVGIGDALMSAFGDTPQSLINAIIVGVQHFALYAVDAGIAAGTVATVIVSAFGLIESAVLVVETGFSAIVSAVSTAVTVMLTLASKVPIVGAAFTGAAEAANLYSRASIDTTASLAGQVVEAGKMASGQSDLNKSIDAGTGSLMNTRDAIIGQMAATDNLTASTKKVSDATHVKTAEDIAAAQAEANAALVAAAHAKAVDTLVVSLVKGSDSLLVTTDAFNKLTDAGKLTIAMGEQLLPLFDKIIAQGGELTAAESKYYASVVDVRLALEAKNLSMLSASGLTAGQITADTALGMTQAEIAEKYGTTTQALSALQAQMKTYGATSKEDLEDTATAALKAYDDMINSGQTFSHAVLDAQLQKWRDAKQAAMEYGQGIATVSTTAASAKTQFDGLGQAVMAADEGMDATKISVVQLDGSVITLAQALQNLNSGNSVTYDLSTEAGIAYYRSLNPAAGFAMSDAEIEKFAAGGGTLQELIAMGAINPYQNFDTGGILGSSIPGAAGGGTIMVGEKGPEVVKLPFNSTVYPTGTGPGGGGATNIYVQGAFGTMDQVTAAVRRGIFESTGLKMSRMNR